MQYLSEFIQNINTSKNVVIISHIGPDGDTLGSTLALCEALKTVKSIEKIDCIINGKLPDIYKFLPGIKEMKTPYDESLYGKYDLAISIDCAALDRMGDALPVFKKASKTINIDHHVTGQKFGDVNIIDPDASSSGEVMFDLFRALDFEITKDIAVCLYTAILTDTGGFRFSNTTSKTFEAAKYLVDKGISPSLVYKKCYESKPIAMFKLHNYALDNTVFEEGEKIAYTMVSRGTLKKFGADDDHIDGIVEALKQIDSVEIAMVLKETLKGDTKISFRSKEINVAKIAQFFGGGGHDLAAGCTISKPLGEALDELLPIVKKQVRKHYGVHNSK